MKQRLILVLAVLVAMSGCATFSHKKPAQPAPAAEKPAAQPNYLGKVTLVNESLGFVLIEASPSSMPATGQALKCFSNGAETGIVAVSAERNRPFVSADIVKGTPHQGDEVYQ